MIFYQKANEKKNTKLFRNSRMLKLLNSVFVVSSVLFQFSVKWENYFDFKLEYWNNNINKMQKNERILRKDRQTNEENIQNEIPTFPSFTKWYEHVDSKTFRITRRHNFIFIPFFFFSFTMEVWMKNKTLTHSYNRLNISFWFAISSVWHAFAFASPDES